MRKQNGGVLVLLGAMMLAPLGHAGEFNEKSLLTGERAAGFGGAYVALSDDNAGMFYNPAGLVHADDLKPSASVNLISSTVTEYDNVFGNKGYQRESLEIVPGLVGGIKRIGGMTLGASVVVVDSLNEDQSEDFENVVIGSDPIYDRLLVQNDYQTRTYNLGMSAAWPLTKSLSLGATLYLHYRDKDASLLQRASRRMQNSTAGQDSTAIVISATSEDSEYGLKPIIGLQYRTQRVSIGLAASRVYPFKREYRYSFIGDAQTADQNLALSYIDTTDQGFNGPWELSAGLAWFGESGTMASLQIDFIDARSAAPSVNPGRVPPRDLDTDSVVNVALGIETPWGSTWRSRVGLYTNFANNEVEDAALFERREDVDMYGLTLSLSRVKEDVTKWTVGAQFATGDGKATLGDIGFGGSAASSAAVDAKRQRLNLFVSTGF